jgi:hypothetical protein
MISCTDDDREGAPPLIHFIQEDGFISTDTSISPGRMMRFNIEATAGDFNITEFLIRVKSDSVQTWFDTGFHAPYLNWQGNFTKSFNDNEAWEFIVRDRYGLSSSIMIFINNDTLHGHDPIETYLHINMGAQNNLQIGGFFSMQNQLVYLPEDAQANQAIIDLVYYFGEDDHTLASPGANIEDGIFEENISPVSWDIRNTTRFIKTALSDAEFDATTNDSILIVCYTEGEGKRKAKNLADGGVFSFKTQNSKFGLFKINEVNGSESGNLLIDIKIQQ